MSIFNNNGARQIRQRPVAVSQPVMPVISSLG